MSKRILSVSYDGNLLATRRVLLEREGHRVTSALGFTQCAARCAEGNFDLFILGHSIPDEDRLELIKRFRMHSAAPVLALRRYGEEPEENEADTAEFQVVSLDPADLLKTVARILHEGPAA